MTLTEQIEQLQKIHTQLIQIQETELTQFERDEYRIAQDKLRSALKVLWNLEAQE